MAKNKKPAKKYRPRVVLSDNMSAVKINMGQMPDDHRVLLKTKNNLSLASLNAETGDIEDWRIVNWALVYAETLCKMGIGKQYLQTIDDARRAHRSCAKRHRKFGLLRYEGNEYQLVRWGMDVHDVQLEAVTVAEMDDANKMIIGRLHSTEIHDILLEDELQ